jgi:hypothetical protein
MDRRHFLSVLPASVLAAPAAVAALAVNTPPADQEVYLTVLRQLGGDPDGPIWGQCINWFDMVPGDIVRVSGYPDGHREEWQIRELPTFDSHGVECVHVSYSKILAA